MGVTFEDFIAGWIGGVAGLTVGHPLDTIKVRQQTMLSTMFEATSRTFRYEGLQGFYKGCFFPLITVGPQNAVFFGVYSNMMKYYQSTEIMTHDITYSNLQVMKQVYLAGTVAGFVQTFITCPVEYIKTILQTQTGGGSWKKHYVSPYHSSLGAFLDIFKNKGVRGLYRGFVPILLRDVPAAGLYTMTYELLMYFHFAECKHTPIFFKYLIAGGTAGIMNWIFVIPVDVVKTRIQADDPNNPIYKSTMDCVYKTYEAGGWRIFFKGLPAVLLRTFPVNGVIFIVYETALSATRIRLRTE